MNEVTLPDDAVQAAIDHMNHDHRQALLALSHALAGAEWATTAELTTIDSQGFDLTIEDGHGRKETRRLAFAEPVDDIDQLRSAFIQMAGQANATAVVRLSSSARVATAKAERYLKALCNHFNHEDNASYAGNRGHVGFPFGECELVAEDEALLMQVSAESETMLARMQQVVGDHLVRFGVNESLVVSWD